MGKRYVTAILLSFAAMIGAAAGLIAGERQTGVDVAGVFVPQPPPGKGERCVTGTDFMRRNHMKLLQHQRADTVHQGIRTKRFSLKGCIDCHAVKDSTGTPVTVKDERHFCRACHDYAAVKVDCFECHASRPVVTQSTGLPSDRKEVSALASYLEELER